MKPAPLISIVETEDFIRRAAKLLTEAEREDLKVFLAGNPTAGVELGSGVRKLRWGARGRTRVIHFFADKSAPLFLLDVFAKSDKANISDGELAEIRALAKEIAAKARS